MAKPRLPSNTMASIEIPSHWSAQQALATYEFLDDLMQSIWARYENEIIELVRPDLDYEDTSPPDPFDPDDPHDIPF